MLQKIKLYSLLAMLTFTLMPSAIYADGHTQSTALSNATASTPTYERGLLIRLDQINAMDKNSLTHKEKKALKTEVKAIQKSLHISNNGGIYLSGGAVILIIILLIILL